MGYGGNHGDPATLTNGLYLTDANYALFARLIPTGRIYKCPADTSAWPVGIGASKKFTELRSYAMNSYIGIPVNGALQPISLNPAYKSYFNSLLMRKP